MCQRSVRKESWKENDAVMSGNVNGIESEKSVNVLAKNIGRSKEEREKGIAGDEVVVVAEVAVGIGAEEGEGAEPRKEGERNTTQDLAPRHGLALGRAHAPKITVPNVAGLVRDPDRPLVMVLEGIQETIHLRNQSPVQGQGHLEVTNF